MDPAAVNVSPGTRFGSYEIVAPLGRGGMAHVYVAEHIGLRKRVALKTLHAQLAEHPVVRARFLREGQATSRIQHPHIVAIHDVGVEGNTPFLVMDLLAGQDLAARLEHGPLPVREAVDVLVPIIDAIAAAHRQGVVHRDLKPSNIMLTTSHDGGVFPVVLDFGLAKLLAEEGGPQLTVNDVLLGTPWYMPPEQARSATHATEASDQYALGVILYECLTGRRPFQASLVHALLVEIVGGTFPSPRQVRPEIPEPVDAAVVRAMSREPEARFQSVLEFGRALLPFASMRIRETFQGHFGGPRSMELASTLPVTRDSAERPIPPPSARPTGAGEDASLAATIAYDGPADGATIADPMPRFEEPAPPEPTAPVAAPRVDPEPARVSSIPPPPPSSNAMVLGAVALLGVLVLGAIAIAIYLAAT
ncbi:MAG: serine/threonine protein kinase [Sandaracinaceae bacterium]|nr:serine/threonine protein kinase [Sandaracinaceae bacterium]